MNEPNVYANGFQIHLNEVAFLSFGENSQDRNGPVARVVMLYELLKDMHRVLGESIEQHDKKLGELQRTKANMN